MPEAAGPEPPGPGTRAQVLITRPDPMAAETARQVAAMGFEPVVAPLLRIRMLDPPLPAAVDAVLVSSGNAVAALPPSLHGVALLAVGDATARRAAAAGFTNVRSADGDADALVALVQQEQPHGAILLLASGAGQGLPLAAALRGLGFRVHRRAVYSARAATCLPAAAAAALQSGRLHAVLFLSAETARAFARLVPQALYPSLAGVQALVIGQPAADALSLLPWRRVRVSVKPTMDHILAML